MSIVSELRQCTECPAEFVPTSHNNITCSPQCAKDRANRLRVIRFAIDPDYHAEVCAREKRRRDKDLDAHHERRRLERQRNAATYQASMAKYYAEHHEELLQYQKDYRRNNPEKVRAWSRERRAREYAVESESYTEQIILDVYGTTCYLCGEEIDLAAERQPGRIGWERGLHLDHVIPIALGGPDVIANIRPTHGKCNLKKKKTVVDLSAD